MIFSTVPAVLCWFVADGSPLGVRIFLELYRINVQDGPSYRPSFLGRLLHFMSLWPNLRRSEALIRGPYSARNLGSGATLAKKRIHRFQKYRPPPRYHLREFRIQSRFPMEIELVPIQTVYAGKVHASPGNLELKLGKGNHAIGKRNVPFRSECTLSGMWS